MQSDQSTFASHVSDTLTARKGAVGTLDVGTFVPRLVDVNFLSNAQVISTANAKNSQVVGNLVYISFSVELDMLVDFNAYPVVIGNLPLKYAPINDVYLISCLKAPLTPPLVSF